jgi:hypothetical protein
VAELGGAWAPSTQGTTGNIATQLQPVCKGKAAVQAYSSVDVFVPRFFVLHMLPSRAPNRHTRDNEGVVTRSKAGEGTGASVATTVGGLAETMRYNYGGQQR